MFFQLQRLASTNVAEQSHSLLANVVSGSVANMGNKDGGPAKDRPSSEQSRDMTEQFEEEDALLTNESTSPQRRANGWAIYREVGLFAWAVIATALVVTLAVLYQQKDVVLSTPVGKRNLIFMVSDGMGPTSLSLTRSFRQTQSSLPIEDVLLLDHHHIGSSRTRSTSSLITDSAAGATAFSCGLKSYNGAISVLPDHSPCGTILEAAKKAGYMTGLVVTTRITDATPACFAAHVQKRSYEDRIAEHMTGLSHPMGRVLDLMLGGGRCHFLPKGSTDHSSCRDDDKDIASLAQKQEGWNYIDSRAGFDSLELGAAAKLPLLGLFADTDIPYEIDRAHADSNATYPSLDEMARTALTALTEATKDSDQGFFLMIEGSRIDHAGHGNDPVAQVHEVIAYDTAFSSVIDYLEQSDTPGVLVGTSDHETGGLATARQLHDAYPIYHWFPDKLINATHSAEFLAQQLEDHRSTNPDPAVTDTFIKETILASGLGITDASTHEMDRLTDPHDPWPLSYLLSDMISRRAQVGWSTHGHSAADVNIYASSPKDAKALIGNHENTEVGEFLRDYLDVNVDEVTKELNDHMSPTAAGGGNEAWMGEVDEGWPVEGTDHYGGDFRRR